MESVVRDHLQSLALRREVSLLLEKGAIRERTELGPAERVLFDPLSGYKEGRRHSLHP